MPISGSTIQTAGAVTWGLVTGTAPLLHRLPDHGGWGSLFWTLVGIVWIASTVLVLGLAAAKLIGDALWPDWIDRWWDPPANP